MPPHDATRGRSAPRPRLLVVGNGIEEAGFLVDSLSNDYDIDVVPDGGSALTLMRARCPDVVLSDVATSRMGGIALVRLIRSDPVLRDVPVLLLSAQPGQEESARALESGADDYIAKPFALDDVRSRLAANLSRARERGADAAWRRAVLA
ncbi:MAG: response regulator, partial [Propionibacteriaceae bacterium]|nr:response regulator [Propionibacteriaceae bacterium]